MIFLSIIIPAHNAQQTIVPLLASVSASKKNKPTDVEVIVVDDASSDNTVNKIQQFIQTRAGASIQSLRIIQFKQKEAP